MRTGMRSLIRFLRVFARALGLLIAVNKWRAVMQIAIITLGVTGITVFQDAFGKFMKTYLPHPGGRLALILAIVVLLLWTTAYQYLKTLDDIKESRPNLLIHPHRERRRIRTLTDQQAPMFLVIEVRNEPKHFTDKTNAQNVHASVTFTTTRTIRREVPMAGWIKTDFIPPAAMSPLEFAPIDLPHGARREMAIAIQYKESASSRSFFVIKEGCCSTPSIKPEFPWTHDPCGISDDICITVQVRLFHQGGITEYRFPLNVNNEGAFNIGSIERRCGERWRSGAPLSKLERFKDWIYSIIRGETFS